MAMTDYTSKLVHTGYANGNSARPIQVYVAYKSSQSIDTNRSTIYVGMYVTTIAGYPIGAWDDFNGSYVGTTALTFDGSIPNFSGTRWLVENKSFTVDHNSPAHTQRSHIVDMTGQDGNVTGNGADNELFCFAVVNQAVRRNDLQFEGGHALSPPRNLATTSSMEPAYRK